MKVLAVPYRDLCEMAIHVVDGTTIERVVASAREEGVTLCAWARESANPYAFRAVGLKSERPLWERAIEVLAPVWVMADYPEPTLAVYGKTQIIPSRELGEEGTAFWIERVSQPTGDLATGDREDERFTISHVNPLGGTEREEVWADGLVAAAEKYASYVCDLYGESHFTTGDGRLLMQVVDPDEVVHAIEMSRDLTMSDPAAWD